MPARTSQLQIRVTVADKRRLKRLATEAGQDVSAYVLSRVLPNVAVEFGAILGRLRSGSNRSHTLAALHDLLAELPAAQFDLATSSADVSRLAAFEANYVAAMVEQAATSKGVLPPPWAGEVPPLNTPYFATSLRSLRLHLLRSAPIAFKRRNLFVDAVVGQRV